MSERGKKESEVSESVAPSVRHQRTSLYLYAQDINFYTTENVTLWLYSNLYIANKYSPSHKKRIHIIDTCLITPDRATDWVVHPDAW